MPDLRRHGVVEAHAGTGKTYTIVSMVLELLKVERLELRRILLVTYTQKAAGELAERIREGVAKAMSETEDEALRAHLRTCLGQLSECWIGTIHGVALRILRSWPFESGLAFRTELVDDEEGLETELRAAWRRAPYGLSDEEHALLRGEGLFAKLLERALDLAKARLDPDAVVLPVDCGSSAAIDSLRDRRRGLPEERALLESRVATAEADFLKLLGDSMVEAAKVDAGGFSASFAKRWSSSLANWSGCLGCSKARGRNALFGKGKPIGEVLATKDKSNPQALEAVRIWNALHEAWTAALEADCARMAELEGELGAIDDEFRARILAAWATEAARRWRERKLAEGLLSYQDMLERLRDAVGDDAFRGELRKRIRVGIIDEFQDTSALQWDIFRRWFVDDNPSFDPRLFLVGDPKQSIYSFQGADVRTYLRACEDLVAAGGSRFALRRNWRSTPELIAALNGILRRPGWFSEDIVYDARNEVLAPERKESDGGSANRWIGPPVRIVRIEGSAGSRRAAWANHVAATILSMKGGAVRLPKGEAWKDRVLDWGDFAVTVQSRKSVAPLRRAFRRAGIPFALYKENGVFSSRAAREFSCLLGAVAEPPSATALKLRALFTRFFGVVPSDPRPSDRLSEGAPESLALERFASLSREGRWPVLFREILARTGIQRRILSEPDGDRHWMDLRQTMQHALEYLALGRGGLPELLEHLGRLARGDETAVEDRNIHARATDRGRVQILTMHVSKGLEFPVVFLFPSRKPRRRDQNRWIAESDGRYRLHVAPRESGKEDPSLRQAVEENGRLLYVALTRPKLLLAAPLFVDAKGSMDDILSERLADALSPPPPGTVLETPVAPAAPARGDEAASTPSTAGPARRDPADLRLAERSRFLSSYSALSRSASPPGLEGRPNRSEEEQDGSAAPRNADRPDAWLPRGAATGDALHEILESMMRKDDLSWCAGETPAWFERETESALAAQGLDRALAPRVARLLMDVVSTPIRLPGGDRTRLSDLPAADRRPEVEFHCAFDGAGRLVAPGQDPSQGAPKGWLVGYVDLLFRHGGVWHVLDWKTTSLPGWDDASLREGMDAHDYGLQAALYARVVADAPPSVPCGGAVYVFLRASAGTSLDGVEELPGVWTSAPRESDAELVRSRLDGWLRRKRNPSSRSDEP